MTVCPKCQRPGWADAGQVHSMLKVQMVKPFKMDNDEFSFGYEFVQKATLREINFGEKDIVCDKLSVAGVENVRKESIICKYCGKIQVPSKAAEHTKYCKVSKVGTGD